MKKYIIVTILILTFFLGGTVLTFGASFDLPNIPCPAGIECASVSDADVAKNPAAYIARIYQIALAIAGVLAVGIIVTGSLFYTFAGGSTDRQREGKDMITSALWGIALLFGSYLILKTVNPRLVLSFGVIGGPPSVATRSSGNAYSIAADRLRSVKIRGETSALPLTKEELEKAQKARPQELAYCTGITPAPSAEQTKACIIRAQCNGCVALDSSLTVNPRICQWGSEGSNCIVKKKTNDALLQFTKSLANQGVSYRIVEAYPPTNYQVSVGHYNGCSVDVSVWSSGNKTQCEAVTFAIQKAQSAGFDFYNEYGQCLGEELAHVTGNLLHLTTQGCP